MNLSRAYLLVLVVIFAYLSLLLVVPFLQFVLAAVLLAYVLYPLQSRLDPHVSSTVSAFSLVGLAIAGFVVPFALIVLVIAGDAARLVQDLDAETLQFATVEDRIEEVTGIEVDLTEQLVAAGEELANILLERTTEIFGQLTHTLVGLGLLLFLLYYLLKDGDRLMGWIREITPLDSTVQNDLYEELDDVMRAVLLGHVLIAIVEGTIAGIGLFVTGIPNAAFWTFIMIVLSLVPLIGAFLVWGPAVAYLFLTGEPLLAAGLFVYSAVVVGVSDDYLRPIVVNRYAELSPAVIIVGVLGGIYAFGIMGLFFGPVILGALVATLSVVDEHYHEIG